MSTEFTGQKTPGPLAGIRVLDLTRILAGPYATMLLGDLGADVIKIEAREGGDGTRQWQPPSADNIDPNDPNPPESAYYLSINRNKRSVTVNLKHPDGVQLIKDLAKESDVVVENYVPGKLDQLGVGYHALKQVKEDIIFASLTGYGQTGPYSCNPAYDVVIAAEAGLMHITGEKDRPPVKTGVAVTDIITGLHAHGAIIASLLGREKTGQGQWIDASLFSSQISTLANIASNWLIKGQEATRMGTAHPSIAPYQVFPTKDSYIMIAATSEKQFAILCREIGKEEWIQDERYRTNGMRVANRGQLIPSLEEIFKQYTTKQWIDRLNGKGMPFSPVNGMKETFAHPQVAGTGLVQEVDHPRAGKIKLVGPATKYSTYDVGIRRPPPSLGEHTDQVLKDVLGYSSERINKLRKEKAI